MATYKYEALRPTGDVVSGTIKAKSQSAARVSLSAQQLRAKSLVEQKSPLQIEISKSRIKPKELMYLSRQLAAFVAAGIPILDAINELTEESDSRATKRVLGEIGEDLRTGSTLKAAFDKHPKDFPEYYRGILGAAELTGRLDSLLLQLSDYLERDIEAKRKLRSALTYPAFVLVMSIGTVAVLSAFVLPAFADLFSSLGAELPLPTRMLIGIANFVTAWGWLIFLLALATCLGVFIGTRFRKGRKIKDQIMLKLPVVGGAIRFAMIERFTRILASTVNAGIPIPEAMRVAADSVTNLVYRDALLDVRRQMLMGEGLAEPLTATGLFPGMASQMFRVGEATGTLDGQLDVAAEYYARELDYKVERLAALVEPTITIIMGFIVGFVAVALVSAMYGIYNTPGVGGG